MPLRTKFTIILVLVLLSVTGVSALVVLRVQERNALDAMIMNSSLMNTIVLNSVKDAMKKNDSASVKEIISNISDNPRILTLRILSRDGIILVSKNEEDVGSKSRGYVLQGYRLVDSEPFLHDSTITSYRFIRNELGCVGCHSSKQDINGVIELVLDIAQQKQDMTSTKKFFFFANLLTILLASALLMLFMNRKIMQPLGALLKTIRMSEKSGWSEQVSVRGSEEIRIIGRSFNRVVGEMKNLSGMIHSKEQELLKMKSELGEKRTLEDLNSRLDFKVRQLETANKTVLTLTREVRTRNDELEKTVEQMKSDFPSTLRSVVNAIEAAEDHFRGHSERVRFLAVELARHMGLEPGEIEALEYAAILHDIGKIGVDSSLFSKPGALLPDELRVIRSHPVISDEIIGPVETVRGVKETILQHHERYDGSGYPFGLAGDEITLKARILSVADTFDAMVTPRPYRSALHIHKALDELMKGSGKQFDPSIVTSFVDMVRGRKKDLLARAGYESAVSLAH